MTFKDDIFEMCREVAGEFTNWNFVPSIGGFKNKTLKHTDLIVHLGFYFQGGLSCSVQPSLWVVNKQTGKLAKQLFELDTGFVSIIRFQQESGVYRGEGSVKNIFPERLESKDSQGVPIPWSDAFIVRTQAKDYFRQVLNDGVRFLHKYYDISSEENLLRHLPIRLRDREPALEELLKNWGDEFYEGWDGIRHCLAAIVVGNFDFVEHYASDDFKTGRPKNEIELQKIMAALPELKRKFAETGKVI
jgi:hypothetical protein